MAEKAILQGTTEGTVPRQSSVLFSLKELMHIEERRVEEEPRARAARSEAFERARRDASARALAEEAERLRLEREEQKAELILRAREETHRHAMRLAEIERARVEAVENARAETTKLELAHERQLVALRNDLDKRRLRCNIVATITVSVVLLGSTLAIYFAQVRPESLARQAQLEAEIRGQSAETARMKQQNRDRDAQLAELMKPKPTPPPTPLPPSATAVQPLSLHPPVVKPRKVCPKSLDPLDDCL